MIYLFTTAFRDLYKRDLINTCSFEKDTFVQFGYLHKHVPDEISTLDENGLKGKGGVVVYCEYFDVGDLVYRYHPVRLVLIEKASFDRARNLSLVLRMGEFFTCGGEQDDLKLTVDDFQTFVGKSQIRPSTLKTEREQHRPQKFLRNAEDWKKELFNGTWESLVNYMGELKGLDDSFFLRWMPQNESASNLPDPTWDTRSCRMKWQAKGGKSYDVRVLMHPGKKAKVDSLPTLSLRNEVVTVLGPFARQFSGGLEIEYIMDVKKSFQPERTLFTLRVEPDRASGATRSGEIQGVLNVTGPGPLLWWAIGLLAFGSLIQAITPAPEIIEAEWLWNVRSAYLFSFGIKLLGAGCLALGAYLGLRKLPYKTS